MSLSNYTLDSRKTLKIVLAHEPRRHLVAARQGFDARLCLMAAFLGFDDGSHARAPEARQVRRVVVAPGLGEALYRCGSVVVVQAGTYGIEKRALTFAPVP